jgi:hypothetical protein
MLMPRPLAIGNVSRSARRGFQLAIDQLLKTISVSDPDCLKSAADFADIMRKKQRLGRWPRITSSPGTSVQSQARISDRDATTSEA